MSSNLYINEGDVVYSIVGGTMKFAEVLESELLSVSDDSFDGVEGGWILKPGHLRVRWHPSGYEEVVQEQTVILADRNLRPGKWVRRTTDGIGSQLGYCRSVDVSACVQVLGTECVFSDVNCKNLIPLKVFEKDMTVCLDSWVGRVSSVNSRITLHTSDGSRCVIKDVESDRYVALFREKGRVSTPPQHYPYSGQRFWGPVCGLKQADWLYRTRKLDNIIDNNVKRCKPCWCCNTCNSKTCKNIRVTVDNIETESVGVRWLCRAFIKDALSEKEWYDSTVSGDDLKRLKVLHALHHPFDPKISRLGQRFYYTPTKSDATVTRGRWLLAQREAVGTESATLNSSGEGNSCLSPQENDSANHSEGIDSKKPAGEIKSTGCLVEKKRKVQDSTKAMAVSFKTRFVKGKLSRARVKPPSPEVRPGTQLAVEAVSSVSHATVVWQDGSVESGVPSTELSTNLSDTRDFFPGDFVIKAHEENSGVYGVVQSVERAGRTAAVRWFRAYTSADDPRPAILECDEESLYDLKDHPDYKHRPNRVVIKLANFENEGAECLAGRILESFPEGKILVRWVDGVTSTCWPQDLLRALECTRRGTKARDKSVPRANEDDIRKILEEFVMARTEQWGHEDSVEAVFFPKADTPSHPDTPFADDSNLGYSTGTEAANQCAGEFTIVGMTPNSHKFTLASFQPKQPKLFFKVVRNEHKLLRTSLPSGIWVKGYEDRLHLFSVMIRGPAKTPYEDVLFFFDVQLSPDYPKSPPSCHYVSFCEGRLNPNLYECGKVCVSLLGTWGGEGTEVWTDASNLLQLVVSIQGLILVCEPYFNEDGYERQRGSPEGRVNSQAYNEMVVLKTMQTVIESVRRPPPVFRSEIVRHYTENAQNIINRLESWVEASERDRSRIQPSATPADFDELRPRDTGDGAPMPEFPLFPASKGFCISLRNTLKTLKEVLLAL